MRCFRDYPLVVMFLLCMSLTYFECYKQIKDPPAGYMGTVGLKHYLLDKKVISAYTINEITDDKIESLRADLLKHWMDWEKYDCAVPDRDGTQPAIYFRQQIDRWFRWFDYNYYIKGTNEPAFPNVVNVYCGKTLECDCFTEVLFLAQAREHIQECRNKDPKNLLFSPPDNGLTTMQRLIGAGKQGQSPLP